MRVKLACPAVQKWVKNCGIPRIRNGSEADLHFCCIMNLKKKIATPNTFCFACKDQEPTKNLFNFTPFFLKSPLFTTALASSPRNLSPRSIGRTDDRGTCLKGVDA